MQGDYHVDTKRSVFDWNIPVIDASNPDGSAEFTISGQPDDFFPITVSFYSTKTICDIQVSYKPAGKIKLKVSNITL